METAFLDKDRRTEIRYLVALCVCYLGAKVDVKKAWREACVLDADDELVAVTLSLGNGVVITELIAHLIDQRLLSQIEIVAGITILIQSEN